MSKSVLVLPALLVLTLALANGAPKVFEHHDNPDPGQNNMQSQSFQQTCFNNDCAAGWTDGEQQASTDFGNGQQTPNQQCPNGHSQDYCSQYWLGYGDEWNRSIQQNFNTNQEQDASVNIHGNGNHVQISQGQSRPAVDSPDPTIIRITDMDTTLNVPLFAW